MTATVPLAPGTMVGYRRIRKNPARQTPNFHSGFFHMETGLSVWWSDRHTQFRLNDWRCAELGGSGQQCNGHTGLSSIDQRRPQSPQTLCACKTICLLRTRSPASMTGWFVVTPSPGQVQQPHGPLIIPGGVLFGCPRQFDRI